MIWLLMLFAFFVSALICSAPTLHQQWLKKLQAVVVYSLLAITSVVAASPFFYEYAPIGGKLILFRSGGEVATSRFGLFRASSDFIKVGTNGLRIENAVTFLTENPKVRKLRYCLTVEVADLNKFVAVKEFRNENMFWLPNGDRIRATSETDPSEFNRPNGTWFLAEKIMFLTYQFNNERSKELAKFNNPLDRGQVEALRGMIEPYMNTNEIASYGVKVSLTGFHLE